MGLNPEPFNAAGRLKAARSDPERPNATRSNSEFPEPARSKPAPFDAQSIAPNLAIASPPADRVTWRYLPPLAVSGSLQMAIDAWLLDCHRAGGPPALRFYTWPEPTLSLGYHQRRYPARWHGLTWGDRPVPLVRRPTGGRAVLHGGDLTYAAIASGLGPNRQAAYRALCQFLLDGWRSLGVALQPGTASDRRDRPGAATDGSRADCFALAVGADLVRPDGTKAIGSAQLHRHGVALQHGSMALNPNRALHRRVFDRDLPPEPPFTPRWQNPEAWPEAIAALRAAAAAAFGIVWDERPLSAAEWAEIRAIAPQFASVEPSDRAGQREG